MLAQALKRWIKKNPLVFISTLLIFLMSISLLLFRLTSMHEGPNNYEINALQKLSSLSDLVKNPLDLIYILTAKLLSLITSDLTALRLTSTLFAILTLLNIRSILLYWLDSRTANIGMIITITAFWYIVISRTGGPLIMPAFWLSASLTLFAWLKYTTYRKTALILLLLTTAFGLYTPLFIWWIFSVLIIAIAKFGFKSLFIKLKTPFALIPIVILMPLIVASITNLKTLKLLLGNGTQINGINDYITTIYSYFSQLLLIGSANPSISLGRLPYLDIFQIMMLLIGLVTLFNKRKNLKGQILIYTPVIYVALISVFSFDQTKLVVLLPLIFIIITVGLSEFINFWLKGFPRNPFGRLAGLILVAVLIGASGYYNIKRYYVAWALNPDVKAAHQIDK